MTRRAGLGRGLDSLIPAQESGPQLEEIPILAITSLTVVRS